MTIARPESRLQQSLDDVTRLLDRHRVLEALTHRQEGPKRDLLGWFGRRSAPVAPRLKQVRGRFEPRVVHGHVLLESARADPHEGHPVAVLRVHVRLDLEYEGREGVGRGLDHPAAARPGGGWRR